MGLRLTIRPDERVIINGSILRNAGKNRIMIEIENRSDVLRGEEIITRAEATTPVRRLCYFIQVALASPDDREASLAAARTILDEVLSALASSQGERLEGVRCALRVEDLYEALRLLRPVAAHEERLLGLVNIAG